MPSNAPTLPGARPPVFQKGRNWTVAVPANQAVPIVTQASEYEALILDVYSTAANSVFLGYGSSVTPQSGVEVQPGIPLFFSILQTRELWELQRSVEALAQMVAEFMGKPLPIPIPFYAPAVRIDPSQLYLVATAATNVSVMGFLPQEFQ